MDRLAVAVPAHVSQYAATEEQMELPLQIRQQAVQRLWLWTPDGVHALGVLYSMLRIHDS